MNRKDFKHVFIPSKENGFRPTFLEKFSMGVMLLLVLLSFAMANIQALVWIGSDRLVSTVLPAVIVELTNSERTDERLGVLRRNTILDTAATLKAQDMAEKGYFAHYSPEGISPWYWFDEAQYSLVHAGENLAVHFTDSSDVVTAWMNSPTHKANIMNGNYSEIGVGTARGTYKGVPTVFVVQLFGTPSAQTALVPEPTQLAVLPSVAENSDVPVVLGIESPNTLTEQEAIPVAQNEILPITSEDALRDVPVPSDTVSFYSDFASTSRVGVPAVITTLGDSSTAFSTRDILEQTATQPNVVLQTIYALLAFLVVVALVLSIVIEWRKQNPVQIAYAGGLLVIMALLFQAHTALTSGVAIM